MNLDKLPRIKGNKAVGKRRGRGYGSGKGGHTTGTGTKGQNSRSGKGIPFGFEGLSLVIKVLSSFYFLI